MEPDINVKTGDHGPLLVSVPWLLVFISGVFLCLRIYCKFKRKRHLWWDDYVLIWAWLCLLVDCCCLTYTVSLGFGKHFLAINPAVLPSMGLMGMVGGVFAIFAVMYSKTSFAITLLRISERKTRSLLWFIIISVHIALGGSALIPWIQCKPVEKNWNFMTPGKCWNPKIFCKLCNRCCCVLGSYGYFARLNSMENDVEPADERKDWGCNSDEHGRFVSQYALDIRCSLRARTNVYQQRWRVGDRQECLHT